MLLWLERTPGALQVHAARALFVWSSACNLLVVSLFWGAMADRFSAHQGPRLFGPIASAGTLGALCDAALREVSRIAGSPENVFVVTVQPWTLTARLYPGARWRGTVNSAAGGQSIDMERVSLEEKLVVSGALGLALAAAFWPERRR